jgi:predicted Zn-dependent protease with MMP-like domain
MAPHVRFLSSPSAFTGYDARMIMRIDHDPDAAMFEQLAARSIARLPDVFREHLTDVVVRVREFADRETLASLGMDDPSELTGLYEGRPVGESSIWESGELPPMITLYRAPLLSEWRETGVDLEDLVHHVVVHEVAHHFGLTDDEIHAIEDDAP